MSNEYRKRKPGSCRFSDYYEVQWYNPLSLSWMTIHKPYKTMEEARSHFLRNYQCRIMVVSERGRSIA